MQQPHPNEPASLGRLRVFLAHRVAPRSGSHFKQALQKRFAEAFAHSRRDASMRETISVSNNSEGTNRVRHRDVVPNAEFVAARPKVEPNIFAQNRTAESSTAPTTKFFRSLLERNDVAGGQPSESSSASRGAAPPLETELARQIERESPPQIPPVGLQQFLASRLGLRLPPVRVHVGPAADHLVSLFDADAVSFADRIAMRHHRYEPHTVAGVALLGHELTHVAAAATRTGPQSHAAASREEQSALSNEHRLLGDAAQRAPHTELRSAPLIPPAPMPLRVPMPAEMSMPVRAASVDRPRGSESTQTTMAPSAAQLKEDIFRDLMDRLRTDFERGN